MSVGCLCPMPKKCINNNFSTIFSFFSFLFFYYYYLKKVWFFFLLLLLLLLFLACTILRVLFLEYALCCAWKESQQMLFQLDSSSYKSGWGLCISRVLQRVESFTFPNRDPIICSALCNSTVCAILILAKTNYPKLETITGQWDLIFPYFKKLWNNRNDFSAVFASNHTLMMSYGALLFQA